MSAFGADLVLLVWLTASILLPGIAIAHRYRRLRRIECIAYGAAAGVMLQACLGLCLAFTGGARLPVTILSGLATVTAFIYLWRKRILHELVAVLPHSLSLALAIWFLFNVACIAVTHFEITLPRNLPDGRYVFKDDSLNVKLQFLTSLPADNYLPYVVAEYFLRGISFRDEHPVLPGQEVSNRTILMSLVALPYRATLAMPPPTDGPLQRFTYAGSQWPNAAKLYREDYYRQFLVVGIFLNTLLLLGLISVFSGRARDITLLPTAALLYFINPYMLSQTIFIWPKALAGFFLVLCWHSARRGFHPAVVALGAALAYHSHPYAILFAAGVGVFYAVQWWRGQSSFRSVCIFGVTLLLLIAPWFVWTNGVLQLPSDLLWQNLVGFGREIAWSSPMNFIWVRLKNFVELLTPMMFLVYPFAPGSVLEAALTCLPGAVGVFLILPALREAQTSFRPRALWWCAIIAPFLLITAVFSYPSPTILHGYQAAVGTLIFWAVIRIRRSLSRAAFWSLLTLQLVSNLCLIGMRAQIAGVRFP